MSACQENPLLQKSLCVEGMWSVCFNTVLGCESPWERKPLCVNEISLLPKAIRTPVSPVSFLPKVALAQCSQSGLEGYAVCLFFCQAPCLNHRFGNHQKHALIRTDIKCLFQAQYSKLTTRGGLLSMSMSSETVGECGNWKALVCTGFFSGIFCSNRTRD